MKMRKNNSQLWSYFDKEPNKKTAICRYCNKSYSYVSTTANLKGHLRHCHPDVFGRIDWAPKTGDNEDDEAEELLKVHDLWSFFQTDGRKTRCIICQETTGKDYEDIKAHMKENHPNIMLQMLQAQDKDNSDASSNEDETNTAYTEVVYLEKEPSPEPMTAREKPKLIKKRNRPSVFDKIDVDSPPKRRRDNAKLNENDSDELTAFVKYITCLLKKLPPDVFSNVQIDIINTILRANSQNNSILINKDLPSTSNTSLLNLEANSSLNHNYTITVAAQEPSKCDTDNNVINT
ncbi:uncharacterized protein LOC111351294 [Spodoptera litura]|uniref:Uncharacterized protein LOC111351294 n=1 Tax=Spodoptera litura TaxID=69820 RepID=A0A9J7IM19_SPOLT|nr:uncharacterized protein LOC111351294 [Spodoptera litura]